MFALYMFGRALEAYWGARRFVIFYLVCVLAAALTQLAVEGSGGPPVLGASGGVFGVLLAFAWYFPKQRLILIPIPIPLPAWLFVTLYALVELIFGLTGTSRGSRTLPISAACSAARCASSTGGRGGASVYRRRRDPYRPALRAAGIAQQRVAETVAAEGAPVRQRHPVAAAFDLCIHQAHVQRAAGLAQKGAPRSTSRCPVKVSSAALAVRPRFGERYYLHQCTLWQKPPGHQCPVARLTRA